MTNYTTYTNITPVDPKEKRNKLYRAVAHYADGSTMEVYLTEDNLKKYQLTQELIALGATEEMMTKVGDLMQLSYEEGSHDGFMEGQDT